ncbi:MAG: hypothetical protein C0613_08340 [Desulfobulbaceae bacterium]|mgnify:CR=1 FL=1|nr:MAG: hypothetical protein C0613_08340 [Desulfobulbaceae bacterium]
MITIQSKREGFRRCGVAHSKTRTEYEDGYWSDEDLQRLKDEPMLVVAEVSEGGGGNTDQADPRLVGGNNTKESGADAASAEQAGDQDAGGPGDGDEIGMDAIVAAIGRLPMDDPDLWSASSGKPHVKAVEESLGANIDSARRDEAWEIYQAGREAGE